MFARQPGARRYGLAGALILLLIALPGDLRSQTEPWVARFVRAEISNPSYPNVADTRPIHQEWFWLPQILYSKAGSDLPVAGIRDSAVYDGSLLQFSTVLEGDFGGLFDWNNGCCYYVRIVAARATAVGVPLVTLDTLVLRTTGVQPGDCVPLPEKYITELTGELGENFLPDSLEVPPPEGIGVADHFFGDVTTDDAIGVADAVQILRDLVDLPLCPTCDISLGDVDRDAAVTSSDAVYILRWLVGKPNPGYVRINKYLVEDCQLP